MQKERVVVLIEAKAPRENLQNHVEQIVRYAFREGADICSLTNGFEWWLYLPRQKLPFEQRRFATLRLAGDAAVEQLAEDLEDFLGKDNLLNERAEKRAKQVLQARQDAQLLSTKMPEVWQQMQDEAHEELIEIVRKQVYEKVGLRPTKQQVAAVLQGPPVPPVRPPPPPEPPASNLILISRSREAVGKRARAFELFERRYEVKSWKELLVGVAESLYERHGADFDRILDLKGRHNTVPMSTRNPDELKVPSEIGASGIHINVRLNAKSSCTRAYMFLEHFGYEQADLRIWCEVVAPLSGRKPTGLDLWDVRYQVGSWTGLVVQVAEALHDRHGASFARILELRGRKHPMVSRNLNELRGHLNRSVERE